MVYAWLLTNIYNTWSKTKEKYLDKTWLIQKLDPKSLSKALGFNNNNNNNNNNKNTVNYKYVKII